MPFIALQSWKRIRLFYYVLSLLIVIVFTRAWHLYKDFYTSRDLEVKITKWKFWAVAESNELLGFIKDQKCIEEYCLVAYNAI
jgi:hypothetical protein